MYVRRELIKISENIIDSAKISDLNITGKSIIENSEKVLYDLAEKGSFNSSLIFFLVLLHFGVFRVVFLIISGMFPRNIPLLTIIF